MNKTLDWNAKADYAKTLTIAQLEYAIKDCIEAAQAIPEREGYYHDEASVYRTELINRRK